MGQRFCQHSSGRFCSGPFNGGMIPWNSSAPLHTVQNYILESYKSKKFHYILFKFPSGFLWFPQKYFYSSFLGFNPDRTGKPFSRESCQTETRRPRKNQNCPGWM